MGGKNKKVGHWYTNDEKKEILDKFIQLVKTGEHTREEIYKMLVVEKATVYKWLSLEEFQSYNKKLHEAAKISQFNSTDELLIASKKLLRNIIEGKKTIENTKEYKVNPDGKKVLVKEFIKEKEIPLSISDIKWILEKLSSNYKETQMTTTIQTLMSFNTYLSEKNPMLASSLANYTNNYLSKKIENIEEIKINDENDSEKDPG